MDQQKLRTLVFEKTGVKVDVDDPIFALVALNEAVLEEAVERHVARIDAASAALAQAVTGQPVLPPVSAARAPVRAAPEQRMLMLAGGAAVLGAVLVLLGQAMFFRPVPPPAPVLIAKELTGEQALALKNAEKLNKIIAKLDSKTRNTIQAELQKP
jgi:Tfp pilus assembly protein PilN